MKHNEFEMSRMDFKQFINSLAHGDIAQFNRKRLVDLLVQADRDPTQTVLLEVEPVARVAPAIIPSVLYDTSVVLEDLVEEALLRSLGQRRAEKVSSEASRATSSPLSCSW